MPSRKDIYTADLFHDASGTVIVDNAPSTAVFSPCLQYRYELWRRWNNDLPYCMVIGLNPSTADETENDRTIAKLIGYTRRWGYGALCMTNIFAFRATKPADMKAQIDPIGPKNDHHLLFRSIGAGMVLAAWGAHGSHRNRSAAVLALLADSMPMYCLDENDDGSPRHPLYLLNSLNPRPYPLEKRNSPATANGQPG